MIEFDLRFPKLDPLRDESRVRTLRDSLLAIAGGFTEIPARFLPDIIPGDGLGYIVGLDGPDGLAALEDRLSWLADAWDLPAPRPLRASAGPRRNHGFFLVPKLANRDAAGRRRELFRPTRWARIRAALKGRLSHPVGLVYGEWLPGESSAATDSDVSYMFVFRLEGDTDARFLRRFIEQEIFDCGVECDQEAIYLSIGGLGLYVPQPGAAHD
ncbi:MAG: hypothetical protein PHF00_07215 [Elusimicrobia bacterium]|nr:hypothetical protein [Elusimicrobiota bacterium]